MLGLRSKFKGIEVYKIITILMCCGDRIVCGKTMFYVDQFCTLELKSGLLGVRLILRHKGTVIFRDNYYSMNAVRRKFLR